MSPVLGVQTVYLSCLLTEICQSYYKTNCVDVCFVPLPAVASPLSIPHLFWRKVLRRPAQPSCRRQRHAPERHTTPYPSHSKCLLNIHEVLQECLREASWPTHQGQHNLHHLCFRASLRTRARALRPEQCSGDDNGRGAVAEDLLKCACGRRGKHLRQVSTRLAAREPGNCGSATVARW